MEKDTKVFLSFYINSVFIAFLSTIALAFVNLPPDPGKKGEATLEGIDSNHNGVRDDVERYIQINYANSARTREALMQLAQAKQEKILAYKANIVSLEPIHKVLRAQNCLFYVVGISSAPKIVNEIDGLVMNTAPRMQASIDDPRGTPTSDFYKMPQKSKLKDECLFDSDALPN